MCLIADLNDPRSHMHLCRTRLEGAGDGEGGGALPNIGPQRRGDYALVAEGDEPVGAAWYRTYTEANHGHGFVR